MESLVTSSDVNENGTEQRHPGHPRINRIAQGSILVSTEDVLHIFNVAIDIAPKLPSDTQLASFHDPTCQIPLFHASIPSNDMDKHCDNPGSSQLPDNQLDIVSLDNRWICAKWAPRDFGKMSSPVFAALTTRRSLLVFSADANYLRGPWGVLQCVNVDNSGSLSLCSFIWIANGTAIWLMASDLTGKIYAWEIQQGHREHSVQLTLCLEKQISSSQILLLGSTTSEVFSDDYRRTCISAKDADGMRILELTKAEEGWTIDLAEQQPPSLKRAHFTYTAWDGMNLLYCTAGQVHIFDTATGKASHVELEDSRHLESRCLMAAVGIQNKGVQAWHVILQDGCIYHVPKPEVGVSLDTSIRPWAFIDPPHDSMRSLEHTIESLRGLSGYAETGADVALLCHDANEIASWAYLRNTKSHLGLALLRPPNQDDTSFAELRMQNIFFKIDDLPQLSRQKQALSLLFHISRHKAEILDTVKSFTINFCDALFAKEVTVDQLGIRSYTAYQMIIWIQKREEYAHKREQLISQYLHRLEERQVYGILQRNLGLSTKLFVNAETPLGQDSDCVLAKVMAAVSVAISRNFSEQPVTLEMTRLLTSLLGDQEGNAYIHKAKNSLQGDRSTSLHTGELCRICASPIPFVVDTMDILEGVRLGTCTLGHTWKRCASTFLVNTRARAKVCVACLRETSLESLSGSIIQHRLLDSLERCDLCGSHWILM